MRSTFLCKEEKPVLLSNLHKGDLFEFPQDINKGIVFQVMAKERERVRTKVIKGRFGYTSQYLFAGDAEVDLLREDPRQLPLFPHTLLT
jgi:hypothetical protein